MYSSTSKKAEIKKLIENQIQALQKVQLDNLNSVDESNDQSEHADAVDEIDDSNCNGFFLGNENNFHVSAEDSSKIKLILDTGASKSTISDV
ncbi:hypothetical protein Pst134EB_008475 [Puccinia striiformis f. sp. tritici]|nr:hypothetical protein Pst134EB_008475 [Puccinia striiformis f. sp. tritici]